MEQQFDNRDFERFLKQNADQYRMIPSERIWEGIHDTLHSGRRRWVAFGLTLLLITAGLVTWVMLLPGNNKEQTFLPSGTKTNNTIPARTVDQASARPEKTDVLKSNSIQFPVSPQGLQQDFFTLSVPGAGDENISESGKTPEPVASVIQPVTGTIDNNSVSSYKEPAILAQQSGQAEHQNIPTLSPVPTVTETATKLGDLAINEDKIDQETAESLQKEKELPLITDRVAKTASPRLARKSLKWHLYVTPTISYRTLSENIDFIAASRYNNAVNGGPAVFYPTDVNTMVNHRPDLGFQLGLRADYPVSRWFSLTGGLQFTVSKYDIKAYQHPSEVATIALMDRSVSAISTFRNTNGYKENWLRNFYFSASIPIGAELKLSDGEKNYFGMGATLQPTYVLDNRAYLISADYKNYAELPSLTRKWNLNTSFEIYSAHTTGKVRWRVGPQIRYQMMSSFVKNYPIKEHLFDFGLKLGVQLK